jgi:hypothetical protein
MSWQTVMNSMQGFFNCKHSIILDPNPKPYCTSMNKAGATYYFDNRVAEALVLVDLNS